MAPKTGRTRIALSVLLALIVLDVASASVESSGLAQSPIDIRGARATRLPGLTFRGHLDVAGSVALENTGRLLTVTPKRRAILKGGPLFGEYVLSRCTFHWGLGDESGSEHALQGKRFAGEIQLEHYRKSHGSIENAVNQPEGIAIVSVFLKVGNGTETPIRSITDYLERVPSSKQWTDLGSHALHSLARVLRADQFFTYLGSLTAAPFTENVVWILFPRPIEVTRQEMEKFRALTSLDPSAVNRALQPRSGRDVLFSLPLHD